MERRRFMQLCAAAAAAAANPGFGAGSEPRFYTRALLVEPGGAPLLASRVPVDANLVFNYPFAATPCFLLNLGKPVKAAAQLKTADGRAYEWQGGVGARQAIVAYSAICAHRLTYPTREISFISYRPEKSVASRFAAVIHCCSEHSQYDPADGARVLAGPAPQPLAAILLEHEPASDRLWARGTLGGELFNAFFAKYEFRLQMELGGRAHAAAGETCVVQPMDRYCRQQVKC